jgi:hypothetical protein
MTKIPTIKERGILLLYKSSVFKSALFYFNTNGVNLVNTCQLVCEFSQRRDECNASVVFLLKSNLMVAFSVQRRQIKYHYFKVITAIKVNK